MSRHIEGLVIAAAPFRVVKDLVELTPISPAILYHLRRGIRQNRKAASASPGQVEAYTVAKTLEAYRMITVPWPQHVVLTSRGHDARQLLVSSTKEAAFYLLERWPKRSGGCYRRAVVTCACALKWQVPDRAAKAAFIVAAMDAEFTIKCNDVYSDIFDREIAESVCEIMFEDLLMEVRERA